MALDFALMRLAGMMQRLVVYPERMAANLESLGGVVHSGEVLLALTRAGILREDAYAIVQRCAMATWKKLGTPEGRSFRDNLLADPEVARRVSAAELDAAMDPAMHLRRWTGFSRGCLARSLFRLCFGAVKWSNARPPAG